MNIRRIIMMTAVAALIGAAAASSARADHGPGFNHKCYIKNPAFSPTVRGNNEIVLGQINTRCTEAVFQLGAYGCLEAAVMLTKGNLKGLPGYWKTVECEAARKTAWPSLTLYIDANCVPSKRVYLWRVTGYAWVDIDVAPNTPVYRSLQVNSAYTPINCKPDPRL